MNIVTKNGLSVPYEDIPSLMIAYIAANRARYFAVTDSLRGYGTFSAIFKKEYEYALEYRDEIKEWASDSMNIERGECNCTVEFND